ncbi:MAG: bifunctional adenosylcobinamide kinase/adenosylcobinamide-phosphate guanylyltransferase [Proteobacteria bacterium]|nr:bifunctional adenosylcobinamide kinase/adenosylcobinamide-phosphate guanylyltransferase [Pseudomonadota bacterium]
MSSPLAPVLARVTLVLGGARSGKSLYAETLLDGFANKIYLATAEAKEVERDAEMAARIAEHRERRGPEWQTVEEPLALTSWLAAHSTPDHPVLVDCLTLWLSNILGANRDVDGDIRALADGLGSCAAPVVLVSNEVGLGIVPDNALARAYMDNAGRMNQAVAAAADRVVVMHAGLAHVLKE